MTIVQTIKTLATYLQTKLTEDQYGLQYKSTVNPEEYSTQIPEIYCFTMPSSAVIDTYPAKCPCICITLDGRDDYTYAVALNLCVSNVSISDKETATPIHGEFNKYTMGTSDDYSTNADNDLITESILFTDQICNYMMNYTLTDISEITIEYTDVSLPDFPYAISRVSFKISINQAHIGQNALESYY